MLDHLQFTPHDPNQVYFLFSTTDFYQNNLITTLLYFLVLKIFHGIFYQLRKKHSLFERAYKFLRIQTRVWTLIVAIIEMNAVLLTFSSANQLLFNGCKVSLDRLNLVIMYGLFFCVVVYSLGFYSFVYSEYSRKSSKILIVYTKCRQNSFFL